MNYRTFSFDSSWSLFLDRDGVINKRIIGGYVTTRAEFEFLPGVLPALSLLGRKFGHIFIVSNQQGIGKGLMTEADLQHVHQKMLKEINKHGGRVDKIYYSPSLASDKNPMRKPAPGMAFLAREHFPEIDLKHAVMVGDSLTDMEFGKNAGMVTVLLASAKPATHDHLIDFIFPDLITFAQELLEN